MKTLFAWGDFGTPTGFGVVMENLLKDMYKDFEVHVLAINNYGFKPFDTEKFKMVYTVDTKDVMGFSKMAKILEYVKPDVVYLHQDIFHIARAIPIIVKQAPRAKIVIHFPLDGAPYSKHWKQPLISCHKRVTYSQFGVEGIKQTFPELEKLPIDVMYLGADFDIFKPLSRQARRSAARARNWEDKFVVLNVNRFMPRKLQGMTARAYKMFIDGYNICKCGHIYPLHFTKCDLNLCPKSDIVETRPGVGRKNCVLHLHSMIFEPSMGPDEANTLLAHCESSGFGQKDVEEGVISFNEKNIYMGDVPASELNEIYNLACVNVSNSLGEGAGLSLIEASATGTTSIAPRNSAIPEVLEDTGHLIPNAALTTIALDNGHHRPIASLPHMVQALEEEYAKWEANGRKKVINEAAMELAKRKFNWEDKRQQLRSILM